MTTTSNYVGAPTNRVDGRAKVTGAAKYASEFNVPGLSYGWVVNSAIAKGRITRIDASAALAVPGVIQVFTHENRPDVARLNRSYQDDDAPPGTHFSPLYSAEILYSMQPIALVVAETLDLARYASSLVQVEYETEAHGTDLAAAREAAYDPKTGKSGWEPPPKPRGNVAKALAGSAHQIEAEYEQPAEHHNPMEPHASTVVYGDDGKLTVYDKTQGVLNSQQFVTGVFGLSADAVRVISPYVGGAFGSGLRPQYQLTLAVMAALELKRSVRVTLTRQQMFTFGHRPATLQTLALGASAEGKLEAIKHEAIAETSSFEKYTEIVVNWSGLLYQCDNVQLRYKVAELDFYTPLDMRAPGACTGVFALESAVDELACAAGFDPLEFRLRNYAETDQNQGLPFSSKELRACYQQGAEKFGWSRRLAKPRSMREGDQLIGWGVATGVWDAQQNPASARALLSAGGKLTVSSATSDIGTGTYTIMTQIAAETLGLPLADVTFKLGDSSLPTAPLQGGSWTAGSVGSAVKAACERVGSRLFEFAREIEGSPLADAKLEDVEFAEGSLRLKTEPAKAVTITRAMRQGQVGVIDEKVTAAPDVATQKKFTRNTHSAVFVEVKVDEDLGIVRVTRVVSAIAGGRILNPKTARSQILGAAVWGISMALHEESAVDHTLGRFMNHSLSEYHVPVNADIPDIEVIFVEEKDDIVNPLGAKGLGEIGIVGVAAAVGNAVFHATGRRVRDLPIRLDKLL